MPMPTARRSRFRGTPTWVRELIRRIKHAPTNGTGVRLLCGHFLHSRKIAERRERLAELTAMGRA